MARTLKTVVFMGSAKKISPPWGGDARLGDRVLNWVLQQLKERKGVVGQTEIRHDFTVLDPIELFAPDGALASSGCQMTTPHFMLRDAPPAMVMKRTDCSRIPVD